MHARVSTYPNVVSVNVQALNIHKTVIWLRVSKHMLQRVKLRLPQCETGTLANSKQTAICARVGVFCAYVYASVHT